MDQRKHAHLWDWGSLTAAVLLAAGLRLYQLGSASLWLDEAYTFFFVTGPFERGWVALLDIGNHPPLYYLISRLFASLTASEFGLRLPAALAGIVAVPLTYQFARQWGSPAAGRFAAWLIALNPFAIWYSRDARPNTLSLCLVLAAAWLFVRLYRQPSPGRWLGFVAASGLAYLTHYFATLFALACALFLIVRLRQDYVRFRWWALAQFAAAALISPWFISWWRHPVHSFGIAWIPQPTLGDLPLTVLNLATGWNEAWTIPAVVGAALWALGVGLSLSRPGESRWRALALVWLVAPLLAIFLFSLRRPLYVDRYFIVLLPPLALLCALGFARLRPAWRAGLSLALLASAIASWPALINSPAFAKEDWRAAAGFLRERQALSEPVRLLDLQDLLPLAYYGLRLPASDLNSTPLPNSFWTVARDSRETAHRFSEYAPAITPAAVTEWLDQHHYAVAEQEAWAGLQALYVTRLPGDPASSAP